MSGSEIHNEDTLNFKKVKNPDMQKFFSEIAPAIDKAIKQSLGDGRGFVLMVLEDVDDGVDYNHISNLKPESLDEFMFTLAQDLLRIRNDKTKQ